MKNKSVADEVERGRRKTQSIADDLEYHRRWRATEELLDRISVRGGRHRRENIGIAAQRTALRIGDYLNYSRVLHIRRQRGVATRKMIPARQSSVGVLRRMRRAVERDNRFTFLRANAELPHQVRRRLVEIGRNDNEATSFRINDPWSLLFVFGPIPKAYGTLVPSKIQCLRALDDAIAGARAPGRRENVALRDLVDELIILWVQHTKIDLQEPRYEKGSSRRHGPLADYLRELGAIWKVQLVSTNSGDSMRKAISRARQKLRV